MREIRKKGTTLGPGAPLFPLIKEESLESVRDLRERVHLRERDHQRKHIFASTAPGRNRPNPTNTGQNSRNLTKGD